MQRPSRYGKAIPYRVTSRVRSRSDSSLDHHDSWRHSNDTEQILGMAQYSDGNMNSNDFWEQRKDHPGPDAVRTAAMVATGCAPHDFVSRIPPNLDMKYFRRLDVLSAEDEREALRVRRWRHNIQKVLLQTSPAVALTHEVRRHAHFYSGSCSEAI